MLERELHFSERKYEWPDNYYMETDPTQRKQYLDEAITADPSQENQLRLLLWEGRYTSAGRFDGIDHFLKIWMDLPCIAKQKNSLFGKRHYRAFMEELENVFHWDLLRENSDYKDIWYKELVHFCSFYIQLSQSDKNYSSAIFGVGKLPDEVLLKKIATDLCEKTIGLPKKADCYEKQSLLSEAARKAFTLYYPDKAQLYDSICSTY